MNDVRGNMSFFRIMSKSHHVQHLIFEPWFLHLKINVYDFLMTSKEGYKNKRYIK